MAEDKRKLEEYERNIQTLIQDFDDKLKKYYIGEYCDRIQDWIDYLKELTEKAEEELRKMERKEDDDGQGKGEKV